MKSIAFTMSLYSGAEEEYKRRHNPIWPELELEFKKHGVRHYSIFLDRKTNLLFGYVEIEDEEIWREIAKTNACKKWWLYMKEIMPSNPDNSPMSTKLEEVFRFG